MKLLLSFFLVVAVAAVEISEDLAEWGLREHFKQFETSFLKKYENFEEREHRFQVFVKNLERVVEKNKVLAEKSRDEIHGVTKFSDWTDEEFATMVGGFKKNDAPVMIQNATVAVPTIKKNVPLSLDWRTKGVISPVKDQKQCGSCWAHSAVEAIESRVAMAGGPLIPLSVQQVTSCDTQDLGCNGGNYNTAWMTYGDGLVTEEDYPYDTLTAAGHATACDASKIKDIVPGTKVASYNWATNPCESFFCKKQDEDTLVKNLVSFGPLSIAVDASEWSSYTGGILTTDSCNNGALRLDHAVQLVGYNFETPGQEYFIVKNSWNTDWGYDGYIHLKAGDNTCGFADQPAFVTVQENLNKVDRPNINIRNGLQAQQK